MKAVIISLLLTTVIFSCNPNEDRTVGTIPPKVKNPVSGSGTGTGNGSDDGTVGNNTPSDAPIDGGLSVLLVAGVAYGVRRFRNKDSKGVK
ncbi:MAG TPA: hypothetical protein VEY10_14935 [Flavisolibacter sp.]|jgi:hypothetical protein|nr:hypothetical protein [Flavisolibacter sp.]